MTSYAATSKEALIAELQNVQSKLSELEARYHDLESFGKTGSFECDLIAGKELWSDELYHLWGYSIGEVQPGIASIIANTHADDSEFVAQQFADLQQKGENTEFPFRRILKNGKIAYGCCKARLEQSPSGDPLRIVGFIRDFSERKTLEEQWRRGQRMLNETQKLSGTGGWELDLESNEVHWSENLYEMLGYDYLELPENKYEFFMKRILHPDDVELVRHTLDSMEKDTNVRTMDYRCKCKNGDIKYFHTVLKPENIQNGKVQRLVGAVMDVTFRRRTINALRRSEEKFRIVFEKAPIGIVLFNEESVVLESNPQFLKIFGASTENQYIGQNLLEIATDLSLKKSLSDAIENGWGSFEGYYTSGVTHKTVYVQTLSLEVAPNLFLSVLTDLTKRKKAEEALQESEERYALAVRGSTDGIWDVDLRTGTLYQSPKLVEMLGYASEEFASISTHWRDRVHPMDRERVFHAVEQCLSGAKDTFSEEYRVRRKGGTFFWVQAQGMSAKGADGRVHRVAGAYSDISERKNAEIELIRAKENAEAANKAKNAFLANMSHEIRTPLNGVIGLVQLLQSSGLNKDQKRLVAMIDDTGRNLLKILNDILDLSRIEAGRLKILPEPFFVDGVIRTITGAFAIEAGNKKLEFSCEVDSGVPEMLVGDVTRIRQVLYNLVGNALKYTESGSIGIKVYCLPRAQSENYVRLHFVVVDTGIGIPDDKLDSIFESFTQGETSYTKQYGGTGLGLAIVKNLIKQMGGTLSIASENGKGTEIHVTLKLDRHEGVRPACEFRGNKSQWAAGNYSILLVEDDPVNRIMASRLLEKMGCIVRIASNGREALQMLREEVFDCVLMDIQMPVMDGLEATRRIRADTSGDFDAAIPVVAVTAYAMEGDKQKFLNAGMSAYLSKPVDILALKEVLGDILQVTGEEVQN